MNIYNNLINFFFFKLVPYKNYTDACGINLNCSTTAALTCSSTSTNCDCPSTSQANFCDCLQSQYWNGTQCVTRVTYGTACSQTYMCKANIGLTCNSTSNKCTCASGYWLTSSCGKLNQSVFIL